MSDDRPLSLIPPQAMTEEQIKQELAFWEQAQQIEGDGSPPRCAFCEKRKATVRTDAWYCDECFGKWR